jgi:hypothetical protein
MSHLLSASYQLAGRPRPHSEPRYRPVPTPPAHCQHSASSVSDIGDGVLLAPRSPLDLRCRWAPWRRDCRWLVGAQERRAEPALRARHSAGGRGAARWRCAASAHTLHCPEPQPQPTPTPTPEAKPKPSPNLKLSPSLSLSLSLSLSPSLDRARHRHAVGALPSGPGGEVDTYAQGPP